MLKPGSCNLNKVGEDLSFVVIAAGRQDARPRPHHQTDSTTISQKQQQIIIGAILHDLRGRLHVPRGHLRDHHDLRHSGSASSWSIYDPVCRRSST